MFTKIVKVLSISSFLFQKVQNTYISKFLNPDIAFNRFFDTLYRYIIYIIDVRYDFIDVKRIMKVFNLAA